MLLHDGSLQKLRLLSLRTGTIIGVCETPIINPRNLKIEGFFVRSRNKHDSSILISQDIRELTPQGIVVNDEEVLCSPDELIRMQETLKLDFKLTGLPVYMGKKSLGKVTGYATEIESMFIIKIYVSPHIWRSLGNSQLTIDRGDIIEITPKRIIINDDSTKVKIKNLIRKSRVAETSYSASSDIANASLTEE